MENLEASGIRKAAAGTEPLSRCDVQSALLSTTNKMQRYTIFSIIVNAAHVSGLLAATASGSSKQAWHIPDVVCTVLELLMMGGETARNMYSIDNNKEYCITCISLVVLKKNEQVKSVQWLGQRWRPLFHF